MKLHEMVDINQRNKDRNDLKLTLTKLMRDYNLAEQVKLCVDQTLTKMNMDKTMSNYLQAFAIPGRFRIALYCVGISELEQRQYEAVFLNLSTDLRNDSTISTTLTNIFNDLTGNNHNIEYNVSVVPTGKGINPDVIFVNIHYKEMFKR